MDNVVSEEVLQWAYKLGFQKMKFNEFYEARKQRNLLGIKCVMDAWCKGIDDKNKEQLG